MQQILEIPEIRLPADHHPFSNDLQRQGLDRGGGEESWGYLQVDHDRFPEYLIR